MTILQELNRIKSQQAFTVSAINNYLKQIIEENPLLSSIWIEGEISNLNHYKSGNQYYFTLSDGQSQIQCVLFSSF